MQHVMYIKREIGFCVYITLYIHVQKPFIHIELLEVLRIRWCYGFSFHGATQWVFCAKCAALCRIALRFTSMVVCVLCIYDRLGIIYVVCALLEP